MLAVTRDIIDVQQDHQDTRQIYNEIEAHPAWRGSISGLKAERMLRGKAPYLYILRTGHFEKEDEVEYYATFVHADGSVRHQPFIVSTTIVGWSYANFGGNGPLNHGLHSINDVIHFIMHCRREDAKAFPLFNGET